MSEMQVITYEKESIDEANIMNTYRYRGQSEPEFTKEFIHNVDFSRNRDVYEPITPPLGEILVSEEYKHTWIWNKKAFMGWTIRKEALNERV